MKFTIFTANTKGNSKNAYYPNKIVINNVEDFKKTIAYDHVCAEYKKSHRSISDFLEADCSPFDNDNSHSDDPKDWIYPEQYEEMFPDVAYVLVPSKSNMKEKGQRSARPRHHIYFPHKAITDSKDYTELKGAVVSQFPFFDDNAKDAARFLYGNDVKDVIWHEGSKDITDIISDDDGSAFAQWDERKTGIPEGTRNSTMSHYAGKIIKRLGNTDEAHQQFLKEAEKCNPPLDDDELETIWNSAVKFGAKVASQEGYISPEKYNQGGFSLMPTDLTDVGQATVLATEYKDKLRYSPSTDYMVYNGSYWEESQTKAQGLAQELTERQLRDARITKKEKDKLLKKLGVYDLIKKVGAHKAAEMYTPEQNQAVNDYNRADVLKKYAIKRRDTKYITASLKEARPMVPIEQKDLDADENLLNMPSGTWNLKTGKMQKHQSDDYITKQTAVDPSNEGMDLWEDALNTFFEGDKELIEYVQDTAGLAAIGKVHEEALIIAYGEGRNGKSTFWNTIARVLGSYSGNMSADTLTVGCKRNVKPELAEVKGKRLIIAAELEEGMRLNTSTVKQLCSTDEIFAEKKYKAPFSFTPTHSVVLYTNHLPKVGAIDEGTWRRLIVIPFNAKIEGKSDIKNYSDYLFNKAGGAVLKWILIGAKRVIEHGHHLTKPAVVVEAIRKYRAENDWLQHFLDDCCDVDKTYKEKSGDVYISYRNYCARTGEYTRSTTDFYTALESTGFERHKTKKGIMIEGLCLKSDFLDA